MIRFERDDLCVEQKFLQARRNFSIAASSFHPKLIGHHRKRNCSNSCLYSSGVESVLYSMCSRVLALKQRWQRSDSNGGDEEPANHASLLFAFFLSYFGSLDCCSRSHLNGNKGVFLKLAQRNFSLNSKELRIGWGESGVERDGDGWMGRCICMLLWVGETFGYVPPFLSS